MNNQPLRYRIAHNSIIIALGDWTNRLIGLVSMIVLARLLNPEDFGIASATAAAVIFLRALTYIGLRQYLIQKDVLEQDDINTAWTTLLLYSLIATTILFTFSTEISIFFNEPRLDLPIKVLAFVPLIDAFKSIGLALKARELNYKTETKLGVITKALSFLVTLGAAIILKNYWALIIGELTAVITTVFFSHIMAPYKRSLSLSRYFLQWHFVKWMYAQGILNLIREKIDTLLVTRYLGVTAGGQYAMAIRLSDLTVSNFMRPMGSTLFSAFSIMKKDHNALSKSMLEALSIVLFITLPILIWVSIASTPLVTVLLGPNWLHITPIIPIITAMFCLMQIMGLLNNILIIKDHQKYSVQISAATILLFITSIILSTDNIDIERFAILRTLTIGASVVALFIVAIRILGLTLNTTLSNLTSSPISAAISLIISLPSLGAISEFIKSPVAHLILSIPLVTLTYLTPFYIIRRITKKQCHELNFLHDLLIPYLRNTLKRILKLI